MKRSFAVQILLLLSLCVADANTRLAIGTLGVTPENRDGALADLIATELSSAPGLELVERRELDAVLKEASLPLSGIVRARDAVRFGSLLRADQFLLGTSLAVSGTNRCVIRLVDAKTGVILALDVFRDSGALPALAKQIADLVRAQSKSGSGYHQDYLALGVIQNLGVNNRFPGFPAQMRSSVAANLSGKVTVLERDVISFLANEVRLDLAGLTETKPGQAPQMQFAFWIVDGFYQSYEVAEPEVQLKLRVERVQGGQHSVMLQAKPDEQFFRKIAETILQALRQPEQVSAKVPPTRGGEIEALEARGKQLIDYQRPRPVIPNTIRLRSAQNADKIVSALDEATRVYESILLLDPENNQAKMRLAGCLRYQPDASLGINRPNPNERTQRANDLYREVIATGDPEHANDARINLARSCEGLQCADMLQRFAIEATGANEKQRFRQYRDERLERLGYTLPIETLMPYLRMQLLEHLTMLKESPQDPIFTYDAILFSWRFYPTNRERIVNALLPELLERFPEFEPHILLASAGEQTSPNSPVTAQFLASLKRCEEHPEKVWHAPGYFNHLSSTFEDEKEVRQHGGKTLLQRTLENKQYATVVAASLARQRAAKKGLAPPLTDAGNKAFAEAYIALKQWKEALEILNQLPDTSPQAKNECLRHLGGAAESEAVAEAAWKDKTDIQKVQLAYACMERGQWPTAVSILESMGHRTVRMQSGGAWGYAFTPVLPAVVADECRAKAGLPPVKDPMRFEIGDTPYIAFVHDNSPRFYAIEMEGEDLWMGNYSQIKVFRGPGPFTAGKPTELYDFQRTTQNAVTSISVSKNYVWAGTYDDGLVELDRKTRTCRRYTMADGLLLNGITCLCLQGEILWIGYQNGQNGALGTLDLKTHKYSALTPILSPAADMNSQPDHNQAVLDDSRQPPQHPITSMAKVAPGEMWFGVAQKGLQLFRNSDRTWETPIRTPSFDIPYPAMAADPALGLLLVATREYKVLDGEKSRSGGLLIYDYQRNKPGILQIHQGLPSNDITAVAADGKIAWVGGRGFVGVVDVVERKVLRIAYVSASKIHNIQLTPRHAYIQISCGKESYPDAGNAWTGVYRLNRAEIEPVLSTGSRK